MNDVLKVAIIGTGAMGKKYAAMLSEDKVSNMQLTCICARSDESKAWAEEMLNGVKICRTEEELFETAYLYDALIIATPHKLHPSTAIKAFNLKKHVMCDKPSGVTVGDARRMAECAKNNGVKYGVMFHNRQYPKIIELKKIVASGELGQLKRAILENTIYYRTKFYHKSADWRSSWNGEGGGALINQGQHIIDYWLWLFGMPDSLYASIKFGKYNDFKVDDEAVILMDYRDNMSGAFILSTGEIPREEKFKIVGSKGCVTMVGNTIEKEIYSMDSIEYGRTAQVNSRDNVLTTKTLINCKEAEQPYVDMLTNFANAVLKGEKLIADGNDGINALEITNGAYLSAKKDKRISLPVNAEEYDKMLYSLMEEK